MEVTEKGYVMLARCCRKIQFLRTYACAGVTDAVLKACGQFLPELKVVDTCGAHLLTDLGVQVSTIVSWISTCHAWLKLVGQHVQAWPTLTDNMSKLIV